MEFNEYLDKIKDCGIESLNSIVVDFVNEWNENAFINEFEHKLIKDNFFDLVCDKIIEFKKYPIDIHEYLVDELLGKQAKKLINTMHLSNKIVKDYETKFLQITQIYEKIDFIEARGIDFNALEKNILSNANYKDLKYYADTIEKANISLILKKLMNARTRYFTRTPKRTEENKNLCGYLEALKRKRESTQSREL